MEAAEEKGITGPLVMWHHLDCFAKPDTLESVGWLPSYGGEQLDGYSSLKKPEKKMIPAKPEPVVWSNLFGPSESTIVKLNGT